MTTQELSAKAHALAEEAACQLERWQALFEEQLADAEVEEKLPELKEFTAFLNALKRSLEIARLADANLNGGTDDEQPALDSETLRAMLFEED